MREHIVAIFRRYVAREAGLVQRRVARFSILKISESPAARRRVLLCVLHHELRIHGRPDNKGLRAGKWTVQDAVIVFRRDASPMNRRDDASVWEGNRPFFKRLGRYFVAQL